MTQKVLMCWSGGKDSSMALEILLKDPGIQVVGLLTTLTSEYDRISMHGVRCSLLETQADSIGLPLSKVYITPGASNEEYEAKMGKVLNDFKNSGVSHVAFGDIFLEDLKLYREKNLSKLGLKGLFPLWKKDTTALFHHFINRGFKAWVTCVDTKKLDGNFAGRSLDINFLKDLPKGVDPCGENGEFHSFVYSGPIMNNEVKSVTGERVQKGQFCFCDLVSEPEKIAKE